MNMHAPIARQHELPLGERVSLSGAVVGTSRFPGGGVTYLVQFRREDSVVNEWFSLADLGGLAASA
ncbi:hypothetical protein EOA60_12880 [Mesorhizobium sp. M1A.F.Ca.IN.020.06.1.1]|uniref:hypothetical protein n=1 Tax=unclassified Mesorhizobium TaxID=325217 RepID=UPI000FCA633D|nr:MULTISPECIES: hypothetical protein [unclassified Mesorhizobium]RUV89205.1 hypothetical protein EOA51_04660 [Mesorhizobium sp. M1A.F.Ca.IN.020.32.1.1]RUW06246.1 hypothetical protein EOA46_26520 [Mesorhizobium sp. M1A.F.Ca.IN.022.05.2.1]RUW30712.1 hypothetical protein EOA60_12880 [Mesorhizobium sp. M1A.F.Ca.IN.020.06.1.1]RWF73529.1 MAG: hypothetical protein EOQ35_30010 [Mesorhizobium sp.]RWG01350.1 MAG: hypothetical protein EOQ38_12300 [Mesorhizobium sp.]